MNEHFQEYLRRIHEAGRMPNEQVIDTTDASPRGRPLAFDSTAGDHFRSRPFRNAAVGQGEM
jgi:hypothetical protein